MKLRKIFASAIVCIMIFSCASFAANVEDALSPCPDDSVYAILKLSDTSALLKWLFSQENIETFMPLILAQEESNEILGGIEMVNMFAQNTPLKSLVVLGGMQAGKSEPFFQMAFTVSEGETSIVKKIADGSATPADISRLFLGSDSPLNSLLVSMIKVDKGNDNILRIDNELYMKAYDGMIIIGLSENDIKASINALDHSDMRLLETKPRKFDTKDFTIWHFDIKATKALNDDFDEDADPEKYFDKPLRFEIGFERVPDKFTILTYVNFLESLKKQYVDKMTKKFNLEAVEGGHLNLTGEQSPFFALSSPIDISALKDEKELKEFLNLATSQLKKRFGISEEDFVNLFTGEFSLNVNDSITFEGFRIPAIYLSQTGKSGAAQKVFDILSKSPHFQKVQEGVLQIDSSLSPIACLIQIKGDTLGLYLAELANISKTPELTPALQELISRKSMSTVWLDFAGLQSWLKDSGVMLMLEPIAKFTGFGDVFDAVKDVLNAKFSVPSVSTTCETLEIYRTEYNIVEVNPEEGVMRKIVAIAKKYMTVAPSTETDDDDDE